jgi:hypothetical protein
MEPTYLGGGMYCDYPSIATSSLLCAYSLFSIWLRGSYGPFDAISLRTHHLSQLPPLLCARLEGTRVT